jgi:hypothetical protein
METNRLRIVAGTGLVASLMLLASPPSRGQARAPSEAAKGGAITPAEARIQVDQIARDLREARTAAGRIGDRALRERIEGLLGRAELRARDLSDELSRARPAPHQPAGPLPAPEFDKLLKGLKAEPFDDGKLTYVENFASRVPLSCAQAATLLGSFAFDEKRIDALKVIYPRLVDPHNLNDVLAVYMFPSSKAAARKAVGLK